MNFIIHYSLSIPIPISIHRYIPISIFIMSNLELLVKSLNKLENYTAKYIYKKYIETALPVSTTPETNTSESADSIEEPETVFKYSKKPNNSEEYKLYIDRIFSKERKHIINQNEILIEDLDDMTLADDEYESDPTSFQRQKNNSYPDIKRCSYIRKHKHKLIRCKNSIMNDDEDMCSHHEDKPNMYWDSYNELVENINKE